MFSYISAEARVPQDHPLRPIRIITDAALTRLSRRFARMYARTGRPSIAPEKLLRALLLQVLFSVRSERLLMQQLDYNLLFRWFVGLNIDDPVWDATTFTKNRERLLKGDIAVAFFRAVLDQAANRGLLSSEHFTVDGTLLEAWASQSSFRPAEPDGHDGGGSAGGEFRGERRSNQTHYSRTDPDAMLARKTKFSEPKLAYRGHVMTENRHGLIVDAMVTQAYGRAEVDAALVMAERLPGTRRITLGADRGYDNGDLVGELRRMNITPHVKQNTARWGSSHVDRRTTRHTSYELSLRRRKWVERVFGWLKTTGLMRRVRHRGREKVDWVFRFAAAAHNLVRMGKLAGGCA